MEDRIIIEFSKSGDEICIIPYPHVGINNLQQICNFYYELGYKWWHPADMRKGYNLSKNRERHSFEMIVDHIADIGEMIEEASKTR